MTKRLPILVTFAAMLCAGAAWAQNAVPLLAPHKYFVDGSGNPCVGCMLNTYLAGTTTPTPTYTDSSMTTQNPNPVIMDATGQANIWLNPAITYKFVLQNALGTTLWTADNVSAAGGGSSVSVCGPASTIQIANSSVNGLTCDPNITINTSNHTLLVGGAISGASFSLRNLATIPANWTFDVTTPATALASLSPIPLTDMAVQAADSVVQNASGASAAPTAIALPSGCNALNYSTVSHAWSCASVVTSPFPLTDLNTQAADTMVGNATGASAAPAAIPMPTGCLYGVNYSTSSHAYSCVVGGTVCASGQCYRQNADGSFDEWGITTTFGGAGGGSFTLTYPHAFTALSSIVTTFSPANCDGGSASYCSTGPGGSPNDNFACMIISQGTSSASVAYSSGHTVTSGSACYWRASGY